MLTFGSLQRDLSRVSCVPSPRPWSRRGSVCPSAKPGTVAPRDATGCHGQKPEDLGFSGVFWGIRWISGTMGQNVTFSAMICHDLPWLYVWYAWSIYDLRTKEVSDGFCMASVSQNITSRHPYSPCNMNGVSLKFPWTFLKQTDAEWFVS